MSDFVFHTKDDRKCEVATRRYMRLKVPRLDKACHTLTSVSENTGKSHDLSMPIDVRVMFSAGIGPNELRILKDVQGLPIQNPDGAHFYINGHDKDTSKTTYLCYKELTIDDLKDMKQGIESLIEYLESKN